MVTSSHEHYISSKPSARFFYQSALHACAILKKEIDINITETTRRRWNEQQLLLDLRRRVRLLWMHCVLWNKKGVCESECRKYCGTFARYHFCAYVPARHTNYIIHCIWKKSQSQNIRGCAKLTLNSIMSNLRWATNSHQQTTSFLSNDSTVS